MQADVKVYMKILWCICCCYNILSVDCWIATEIYASTIIEFSLDPNKFSVQSAAELKRGLTAFLTILWPIMIMALRICPNVLQYKYKKSSRTQIPQIGSDYYNIVLNIYYF